MMDIEHEHLMHQIVEEAIKLVHGKLTNQNVSGEEFRLMWLQVIEGLLKSVIIDKQADVIKQNLKGASDAKC